MISSLHISAFKYIFIRKRTGKEIACLFSFCFEEGVCPAYASMGGKEPRGGTQ